MKTKGIFVTMGIPIGVFVLLCLLSGIGGNMANDRIVKSYSKNKHIDTTEGDYQNGIELIRQEKWSEAKDALSLASVMNYEDAEVLYDYANAKQYESEENYFIAKYTCKDIPDYYCGEMAEEIAVFKKEIAVKSDQQLERESIEAAEKKRADLAAHKIWLGMTKSEAEISLGKPYDINRTVGSWGTHEQWCYDGGLYLYFENGSLKSWQD